MNTPKVTSLVKDQVNTAWNIRRELDGIKKDKNGWSTKAKRAHYFKLSNTLSAMYVEFLKIEALNPAEAI